MMQYLYWRVVALVKRRPYPFVIPGRTLFYCWRCGGWGEDASGCECPTCKGKGYR